MSFFYLFIYIRLCWFTHLTSEAVVLVLYIPAGLCFRLKLWCGACGLITLVARSRPAVWCRSNYRRNLSQFMNLLSTILAYRVLFCVGRGCTKGPVLRSRSLNPAYVNYTQKLLWAAITPVHGMEPSHIRAMLEKNFVGQIIFLIRNLLLQLVAFPQQVALRPVNFFSSAVILNFSFIFPKLTL